MFQFPAFAPALQVTASRLPGSPIRTSADLRPFAPTRGFSQLVTSFFASESHRHPPCALLDFLFYLPYMSSFYHQYVYDLTGLAALSVRRPQWTAPRTMSKTGSRSGGLVRPQ